MKQFHFLSRKELPRAAAVMVDAFKDDPLWLKFFEGERNLERKLPAFYEVPLRLGHRYGATVASSPDLEGVASWVPGEVAKTSLWRMLRSGALGPALRMGAGLGKRMERIFGQMERDRAVNMGTTRFSYLQIIGVATRKQGKGIGGRMIRAIQEQCRQEGLALYLETETERNAEMYERLGFELLKKLMLPELDMPMWEMVWEAG